MAKKRNGKCQRNGSSSHKPVVTHHCMSGAQGAPLTLIADLSGKSEIGKLLREQAEAYLLVRSFTGSLSPAGRVRVNAAVFTAVIAALRLKERFFAERSRVAEDARLIERLKGAYSRPRPPGGGKRKYYR